MAWERDLIESRFAYNGSELIRLAGLSDGTVGTLHSGGLKILDNGGNADLSILGVTTQVITIVQFKYARLHATDFAFVLIRKLRPAVRLSLAHR